MMLPSHLLATLLGCALVGLLRPLDARAWALALLFGVVIDLDHLLQIPAYAATHGGVGSLADIGNVLRWGGDWQGFFHTPWAFLVIVPTCFAFASSVPLWAWLGHMFLDFVVARHVVRFGSPLEVAIDAVLLAVLAGIALRDWRLHAPEATFSGHVIARAALVLPRR